MAKKKSSTRSRSSGTKHGKHWDIVRVLVILGAVIAILQAVLMILSLNVQSIILAIVAILISVIILTSFGVVRTKLVASTHWLLTLILGIILIWPLGTWIGGLLVLIGGIIDLVDAL
ncbi:MAG: hypothetical protein ACTSU5_09780 [Promethearchaeota archaeon]